jgi:hypothetical protein
MIFVVEEKKGSPPFEKSLKIFSEFSRLLPTFQLAGGNPPDCPTPLPRR